MDYLANLNKHILDNNISLRQMVIGILLNIQDVQKEILIFSLSQLLCIRYLNHLMIIVL